MALEFICDVSIESFKRIIIPRSANIYKIDSLNNKISFYYSNPGKVEELNIWKVPLNAREIEFEVYNDKIGGYIIIPEFYNSNGNLLKIGNR